MLPLFLRLRQVLLFISDPDLTEKCAYFLSLPPSSNTKFACLSISSSCRPSSIPCYAPADFWSWCSRGGFFLFLFVFWWRLKTNCVLFSVFPYGRKIFFENFFQWTKGISTLIIHTFFTKDLSIALFFCLVISNYSIRIMTFIS